MNREKREEQKLLKTIHKLYGYSPAGYTPVKGFWDLPVIKRLKYYRETIKDLRRTK